MKNHLMKVLIAGFILFLCLTVVIPGNLVALDDNEIDNSLNEEWHKEFKELDKVDYPVIFVHGIAGELGHWEGMINKVFGSDYYEMRYLYDENIFHNYYGEKPEEWVWNTSYYTVNTIQESLEGDITIYAQRFGKIVERIKQITGKEKVIIVAHSMGGLVTRKYMTLNQECWDSVYKILTVGTPHRGVGTSIGIVGQLEDLRKDSDFIKKLDKDWAALEEKTSYQKWGVVGGLDTRSILSNPMGKPKATDSAGPGFVAIYSAIPFGEWKLAEDNFKGVDYNTSHFGFRTAVSSTHMGLLNHPGTFQGILWSMSHNQEKE